jgi:hypothetical protein
MKNWHITWQLLLSVIVSYIIIIPMTRYIIIPYMPWHTVLTIDGGAFTIFLPFILTLGWKLER